MSGRRESQFRKLKKKRIGLSLFMIIFVTIIAHLLLAGFVVTFFYHLLIQKVEGEYEHVGHMARLYENVSDGSESRVKALLDEEGPYFVLDASGTVIDSHGENTCLLAEPVTAILPDDVEENDTGDGIRIYPDREMHELSIIQNESMPDSIAGWLKLFSKGEAAVKEFFSWEGDTKEIPLWVSVPMTRSRQFVGKTTARLYFSDIKNLIIFAVFIAIMIFLVLVIMIINVINNFRHQRKLTEVFFADDLTGAKNRMWLNFKGEQLLKKRKNTGKRFAMLSIVFVNYRNFCVCHSVSEGEEVLNRISTTIAEGLRKQEICAHYASASFGVLLQYNAKPDLQARIEKMIAALEKIDEVHKFSFHVGVDLIEPCVDENGKIVRRREADMEKFYNNASAARATLSDGEESGIVYFDDKLVEEQRWIDTVRERQEGALANGEFIVYYQPKYDPATKTLRGAEALVRWDSGEFGFISPGRFIPIFEKNG
ncbi:MAG: EAL domain-containing protein, partial [Lachnospiraceae bacterium]|nr:EAL domain-containing protein [Lachnospiraceae bacterium]